MGRKIFFHPITVRYTVFMMGLAVMAFGIAMMIEADLGVAPWDTLHIGLQKSFGLTIGIWSQIVGASIILASYVIGRIKPNAGTGPRDSFMLALNERMGWGIGKVRIGIECMVTLLGFLLGGPVSMGTLVTALTIGPLIKWFIPFWEHLMAKPYGKTPKEQLTH